MTQPSQADILAALQAQTSSSSSRKRPSTTAYTDHPDPYDSLTTTAGTPATASSSKLNATRLYCPREGCGSLILLEQTGEWITAEADAIPIEDKSPFKPSPSLPSGTPNAGSLSKAGGYWRINGGPMAFENVGYSRSGDIALPSTAPGMQEGKERKVKWLICAECDLGPVGWSFEGGQDSYLAVDRVRYGEKK